MVNNWQNFVVEDCVYPTITQSCSFIFNLVIINIVFLVACRSLPRYEKLFHLLSIICGFILIFYMQQLHFALLICGVPIIILFYNFIYKRNVYLTFKYVANVDVGFVTVILLLCIAILCELLFYQNDAWLNIRGCSMIIMMKLISLAYDFDASKNKKRSKISLLEFFGYIWCPSNVLLGPWIQYADYRKLYTHPRKITLDWLTSLVITIVIALFFVTVSNCVASESNLSDVLLHFNSQLLYSYIQALSFRTSHYFISYVSSATMISAGLKSKNSIYWEYLIVHPMEVEFPRSLATVITNWNLPTHTFLKKYIYSHFLPRGQFVAIIMTFVISAMLHGLNVKLSVVLISLGIFSYSQMRFHNMLSKYLNSCMKVKKCLNCNHHFRKNHLLVRLLNLIWSVITVIYLAYIGCLMFNNYEAETIKGEFQVIFYKWQDMKFLGHKILFVGWLSIYCMKYASYLRRSRQPPEVPKEN